MPNVTTTSTGRKIRGDSKLDQLNPAQREQLRLWLEEENCTYGVTASRIAREFGVTVGQSSVFAYYHRHIAPERHDDDLDAAAAFAGLAPGDFDAATITKAKALAFTSLARPQPQVLTAARLLDLVHRAGKYEIALKRIALEERRVALRETLAGHPPAKPRASSQRSARHAAAPSEDPSIHAEAESGPAESSAKAYHASEPSPQTPADLSIATAPSSALSATCAVQPTPPSPDPSAPASLSPLPPSPTPDSSFPPFPSVQTHPSSSVPAPSSPPAPASQKTLLTSPLFSGSCEVLPPTAAPALPTESTASPESESESPFPAISYSPYREPTHDDW